MDGKHKKKILVFTCYIVLLISLLDAKRARYISTEHPKVTYVNSKYLANVSFTATRYGRRDPIYYLDLRATTLIDLDNNVTVNMYVYQFPRNGPTLLEIHKRLCTFVHKDEIFGPLLKNFFPDTCPMPKGTYSMLNITTTRIANPIIESLPFSKARLVMNSTVYNERFAEGYIDVEIKFMRSNG